MQIGTIPNDTLTRPISEDMQRDPPAIRDIADQIAHRITTELAPVIVHSNGRNIVSPRDSARQTVTLEEASPNCNFAKFVCLSGIGTGLAIGANQLPMYTAGVGGALLSIVCAQQLVLSQTPHPCFTRYNQ